MTEYDLSPGAQEAYLAKLQQVANWSANVPADHRLLVNPFDPSSSAWREAELYTTSTTSSSRKRRKRKDRKLTTGRTQKKSGYWGESDTDDGGPDRPPTPPASAPALAMGFQGHSTPFPYYYPPQTPQRPVFQRRQLSSNVLVPTWDGSAWVYQPASSALGGGMHSAPLPQPPPIASAGPSNSTYDPYRDRDRDKGLPERASRRENGGRRQRSGSLPPCFSGGYFSAIPNSSGYALHASGSKARGSSPNSYESPWTTMSAPLPLSYHSLSSRRPTMTYFTPQPQHQSPQHSYFPQYGSTKVVTGPGAYTGPGYPPPGWGWVYGQSYGLGYGYGQGGGGGQPYGYGVGGYGGPPVAIVTGPKGRKTTQRSSSNGGTSFLGRL